MVEKEAWVVRMLRVQGLAPQKIQYEGALNPEPWNSEQVKEVTMKEVTNEVDIPLNRDVPAPNLQTCTLHPQP